MGILYYSDHRDWTSNEPIVFIRRSGTTRIDLIWVLRLCLEKSPTDR